MTIEPVTAAAARPLLELHRARAERLLNGVRMLVLLFLASAAAAYAPTLPRALNWANVVLLTPTIAWTVVQWALFYRTDRLPAWLAVVNPVVDITAVTLIIGAYGITQSPALALRSPIFLAYFIVLAARPITSSTRHAAWAAALAVAEYGALTGFFVVTARVQVVTSPVIASGRPFISSLDEGAKLLLLAIAGGVATYATAWHERLLMSYARQTRDREQLESQLARAELQTLKLQLHPHFLFNTLNTITALIATDARRAERVITGLSELLRMSLHTVGEHEVPLERELEVLKRYVEIQQVRFSDRLQVEFHVDPTAMRALVPNLVLQPLVENAIRHGIAPRAAGGRVEISAECIGDALHLRVADDGVGLVAGGGSHTGEWRRERRMHDGESDGGVGLANTRARLGHLYGDRQRFEAGPGPTGGFVVALTIPLRNAPAPVSAPVFEGVA